MFLLLVAALAAGAGAMPDREAYHPPRFHLQRLDDHADDVLRALEREGMLLVTGAPGLEEARSSTRSMLSGIVRSSSPRLGPKQSGEEREAGLNQPEDASAP